MKNKFIMQFKIFLFIIIMLLICLILVPFQCFHKSLVHFYEYIKDSFFEYIKNIKDGIKDIKNSYK